MNVLEGQGSVVLEDSCGDDLTIVNAARQSFLKSSDGVGPTEAGLINYLMRNRHGTPFEMVDFRFNVKAPIFVVREWQRHRIASYNEASGRYTALPEEAYIPHKAAVRGQVGKPGAYTFVPLQEVTEAQITIGKSYQIAWEAYRALLKLGVAKELARVVLPLGTMTRFTFKTNLRSLFNFLSLRTAPNAMFEIREYAKVIEDLVRPLVPVAMDAFEKNGRVAP